MSGENPDEHEFSLVNSSERWSSNFYKSSKWCTGTVNEFSRQVGERLGLSFASNNNLSGRRPLEGEWNPM